MSLQAWRYPVTLRNGLGAYARYLICRLQDWTTAGPVLVPFVNDMLLLAERRTPEATALRLLVLTDFEAMTFIAHFLRREEYFVDVGAGIGSYTVLAAGSASACVTAFEPQPERLVLLRRNLALNEIAARADCRELALGDFSWKPDVRRVRGRPPRQRDLVRASAAPVALARLDDSRLAGSPVMARIDVGGGELAVLRGAHGMLGNPSLCALVLGSGARASADHLELARTILARHGFVAVSYDPHRRQMLPPKELGGASIYVRLRQVEHVVRRLAQAPRLWIRSDLCI